MRSDNYYSFSQDVRNQIREEYELGNFTQEILADKYHISRATVQRYIHKWSQSKAG